MDSTDFSLDDERLKAAIAELEANADAAEGEIEVVVPLRGLRMEATRLELATATIVRADTVDVPAEARASEASGGAGWEPTFLAIATSASPIADDDEVADAGTRSVEAFREDDHRAAAVQARRRRPRPACLDPRVGAVAGGGSRPAPGALGPAATGLPRASSATWRPSRAESTRARPAPASTGRGRRRGLDRAIARFEAGLERTVAIDALNDYLLALRFLLEGGGPADLGLSMRVASLCADPDERIDREVRDRPGRGARARALERRAAVQRHRGHDPGRDGARRRGAGAGRS